ncbi:hypothetical protein HDK64DRAFT_268663 [Phyllosticta capitalensis]
MLIASSLATFESFFGLSVPSIVLLSPRCSTISNQQHQAIMPALLDLSNELLHSIFSHTQADDLARLSETCRSLHQFINSDEMLWKEVHLAVFDDPKEQSVTVTSWQEELSRLWRMHKILSSDKEETKIQNMDTLATTITRLLQASSPDPESRSRSWLRKHFEADSINHHALLCKFSLYHDTLGIRATRSSVIPKDLEQLSAKLHVLHGVYCECSVHMGSDYDAGAPVHAYARSRVYDLRRYDESNSWGPFLDDFSHRVDWMKLSCIMTVILCEQRRYCSHLGSSYLPVCHLPFAGAAPNTFQEPGFLPGSIVGSLQSSPEPKSPHSEASMVKEPSLSLDEQDPYGVAGTWFRIVLFLDYNDLYNFNFSQGTIPNTMPRPPLQKSQATRFIVVRLHVTRIEPITRDGEQQLPKVYFEGDSRSYEHGTVQDGQSTIKGHVRQNPEGEIWWTTMSIFNGEERWRSECIQVGGLRSDRGTLGTWFDKDYSDDGPVGPTCFWKVSNAHLDRNMPSFMRRAKSGQRGWRRYG